MGNLFNNVRYEGLVIAIIWAAFLLAAIVAIYGLYIITKKPAGKNKANPTTLKVIVYVSIIIAPVLLVLLAANILE